MTIAKPWEKGPPGKKKVDKTVENAKKASARKPWDPTPKPVSVEVLDAHNTKAAMGGSIIRMTEDFAMILAKAYAIHGDMVMALMQTGRYPLDEAGLKTAKDNAWKYRCHPLFAAAKEAVLSRFTETDILTRDRVLAGLYEEAADRGLLTTGASRVAAWGKLAMLMGMENDAKNPPKAEDTVNIDKSGVMMIPYVSSIDDWEQHAMGQQAKLKADVRL